MSIPKLEIIEFKTEIITIDDENPLIKTDEIEVSSNIQNGIYFFEPQSSTATTMHKEQKSKYNQQIKLQKIFNFHILADKDKFRSIQISCPSCPKHEKLLFDDKHSYELHFRKTHNYDEISFGCSVCDYISKKFVLLKNHFKKHVGSKKFKCNECEQEFRQKSELNYHRTTEHKLKICRKCNFEFNNFEAYLEHKESHDDLQMVKNNKATSKFGQVGRECGICGKVLMTQGGMITHVRMHSEAPKFRCELCQKEFFQKVNLINHTKTHNIQNRSYSCSKCEKKFFEKSHLQRHQNFHTSSREFECSTCNKFYKVSNCSSH